MISKVDKINIIFNKQFTKQVFDVLYNLGYIQVEASAKSDENEKSGSLNEKISKTQYELAKVQFAISFLKDHDTTKKNILDKALNPKIEIRKNHLQKILDEFDYNAIVKNVEEIENQINFSKNEIALLQKEIKLLGPWKSLQINTEVKPKNYAWKLAIIAEKEFDGFLQKLRSKTKLYEVQKVHEENKNVYALIIATQDTFNTLNIKDVELPAIESSVQKTIEQHEQKIVEYEKKAEGNTARAQEQSKNLENLKIVHDSLLWKLQKLEKMNVLYDTHKTSTLNGWIENSKILLLEKKLSHISENFCIEKVEPKKGEEPPIALHNKKSASPFEFVTGIYGAPGYKDPDPTPFLAPFFVVFFGLCLTDSGYGLLLTVLSILGLKFLKPKGGVKKLLKVLLWGGLATFVLGALVGGYFGIVLEDLPAGTIKDTLLGIRIINPVADPLKMLIFSLGLGIVHLLFGLGVKAWWEIKHGRKNEALFGPIAWFYFICSILFWAFTNSAEGVIASISLYNLYAGVALMILTQGRKAKNIAMKGASGVLSLYGVIGYLADILSYSRLLALGLSTGIIAMVINLIAFLAMDMIPYVGWILTIVILVGGHIFNIIINVLGAFIHSSRLQFVEFFPKFMEESGTVFTPFKKESKYVEIIDS